jgi:hypothetical protein
MLMAGLKARGVTICLGLGFPLPLLAKPFLAEEQGVVLWLSAWVQAAFGVLNAVCTEALGVPSLSAMGPAHFYLRLAMTCLYFCFQASLHPYLV